MSTLRLEVLEGEVQGSTVLSGISVLGRDEACAVVIDDRVVSREHAMIREEPGVGFMLEDLDSRSGTFVNGVRTRKAVLLDGDTVKVGPALFRVRTEAKTAGEIPLEDVELVQTKHMPTQRLSLDAVRFRTSRRYLKDTGRLRDLLNESKPEAGSEVPGKTDVDPYDQPPADYDDDDDPGSEVERRLELLLEITNSLASIHEPSRLIRETAVRLLGLFPQARRIGFFHLVEDGESESVLRPSYLVDRSQPKGAKRGTVQISHSVLQTVVGERRAILSQDVQYDERFKRSESLESAGVCWIICAPLCLGERTLGAVYVDSTNPEQPFDEGALRLLTGISAILASASENARLFARVQAETIRRASLERYFSPDLVERVLKGELPLAREGHVALGTILFVDIRGFTQMTLTTEPNVLVATLNAYFETMQRIIFRTRGTVERFGGDSILAYWGIVDQDSYSTGRAIRAALAMQVEVFRLNPELLAAGRPPLVVGIGLNTGWVIAGDVGSAERHEFTILGDAVNMAARFEGLAGANEIVAGRATVEDLGGAVLHVPLPPTTVKGKQTQVEVSAVFGLHVETPGASDGVRRYDLAVPGELDLGDGPENTIVSGLEFHSDGKIVLEAVTPHDPEPGTEAGVSFTLPRGAATLASAGTVLSNVIRDTTLLPSLNVTGSGLQRIRIAAADPQGFLAAVRHAIPHAGAATPPASP